MAGPEGAAVTTTAARGRAKAREEPTDHSRQLAEVLVDRSGLQLATGVDPDQLVAMLAKVLYQHPSPATEHGRLVLAAMLPRSMPRSPAETAVRDLVRSGQAPTPRAVAGALQQVEENTRALVARLDRLRPQVEQLGPDAAAMVEDLWRQRRKAPSPWLLGLRCGWAKQDTWPLVHLLVEAGWLSDEGRRLTPGPRAPGPPGSSPRGRGVSRPRRRARGAAGEGGRQTIATTQRSVDSFRE